jgi:hypothetical protein
MPPAASAAATGFGLVVRDADVDVDAEWITSLPCTPCLVGRHAVRLRVQQRPMSHAWAVTEPARGPEESTPFGVERDPARVVAFSDAVIAIAVTLLVLEISPPRDTRHLWHGLATLWPSYLA